MSRSGITEADVRIRKDLFGIDSATIRITAQFREALPGAVLERYTAYNQTMAGSEVYRETVATLGHELASTLSGHIGVLFSGELGERYIASTASPISRTGRCSDRAPMPSCCSRPFAS
jgi:hypothetical protein